jgi:DNA mismatch repair protein MutL
LDTTVSTNDTVALYTEKRQHISEDTPLQQMHFTYIVVQNDAGFIVIHQQNAHERILYERFMKAVGGKPIAIQQSLFPQTMELAAPDVVLLTELLPDLQYLGYHMEPFGNNTFVIQGTPADVEQGTKK